MASRRGRKPRKTKRKNEEDEEEHEEHEENPSSNEGINTHGLVLQCDEDPVKYSSFDHKHFKSHEGYGINAALLKEKKPPKNEDPALFQHPFRACVVGGSGSGKTAWVVSLLMQKHSPFDRVIWVAPKASFEDYKLKILQNRLGKKLVCIVDLDTQAIEDLVKEGKTKEWQQCIVFDDMIMEMASEDIMELFATGRHSNVSVIELLQQIFAPGTRGHRVNCQYFVVFQFGAVDEFAMLARKISPDQSKEIIAAYKEIMRKPHGCLIIDLKSLKNRELPLRFRDTELDCLIPSLWNA